MRSRVASLGITAVYNEVAGSIPDGLTGSALVLAGYQWYRDNYNTSSAANRATNGRVFESLVLEALHQEGILPVYYQAKVVNVPNVVYDILLFDPIRPVVLSCKTSLRERWKQADLEGLALKQVYRGAASVLLTLSQEGRSVQNSITESNVVGLDQCIVIDQDSTSFDDLLEDLKVRSFRVAVKMMPLGGTIIK